MNMKKPKTVAWASCPCSEYRTSACCCLPRQDIGRMPRPKEGNPCSGKTVLAVVLLVMAGLAGLRAGDKVPVPPLPQNIEVFTVKTLSDENKEVPFYVRRPAGYDASAKGRTYRILFICPVFNGDGLRVLTSHSLIPLADARGWFVVSPSFKQQTTEVMDRKKSYYYPEVFSGKAVLDALDLIAKKYPVDPNRLLLKGLSGGAQFVHRFALWAPDRTTAVAVNSSSWFDEPNPNACKSAWLVTIGESDNSYNNSVEFVAKLRDLGASPLFRSYVGMVHEGDPRVSALDAAFLSFYDEKTAGELGQPVKHTSQILPKPAFPEKDMPFVGDSQNWKFYPNSEEARNSIVDDNRIFLPSEQISKLWGQQVDE